MVANAQGLQLAPQVFPFMATASSGRITNPGARREMQFVLLSPCQAEMEGETLPEDRPEYVWVYLPEEDPINYEHAKCQGKHWRVTREDTKRLFPNWPGGAFVCEHMGHLCE